MRKLGLLLGSALIVLAVTIVVFLQIQPRGKSWSDPITWGGTVPKEGADVVIPAGTTVVLDASPARMNSLTVNGRLVIEDTDVTIETGGITISGAVYAGSRWHPFRHQLRIVLDADAPAHGIIHVNAGGRFELHGLAPLSWTRLATTAQPGDRELTLVDSPKWRPGDAVVIAPSGFNAGESEERSISGIDGASITLDQPLRFRHWGSITDGVDERAEVGLISHDIVVTSVSRSPDTGGQLMVTRGGGALISGTEFLRLGVRAKLGAYPVHFHLAGDASGSVVASSSVVHSLNRCITIHGTNGVTVRDNVAFDTTGHCIFMEDGIESGNTIAGNLVLDTHAALPARAILESDVRPAGIWITNPANSVTGNVVAGSEGNGIWYSLSPHPTGPSATSAVWPRRTALGRFDSNVAHSNEDNGLFVDILHNPPGVTEAPNYDPPVRAVFERFTSYKNRRRGAWLRGTNLALTNATIADNSIGVTFAGADDVLQDSLVVGVTDNETGPPKPFEAAFPIRGFEFYDGQVGVERTKFVNFEPTPDRAASALSFLRFSPFFSDPTNYARALTFDHANEVFFEPRRASRDRLGGDGYRATVFRDLDGSVTGTAGASVVIDTPLLASPDCRAMKDWNADVCQATFGSLFVVAANAKTAQVGPVRLRGPLGETLLFGNPTQSQDAIFQTNLRSDGLYSLRFAHGFPPHIRFGLHHFAANDRIVLELPQAPAGLVIKGNAVESRLRDGGFALSIRTDSAGAAVIELQRPRAA